MRHEVAEQDRKVLDSMAGQAAGVVPLQFVQVDAYTTFRAEYAMDGADLVFHFFRSPEHKADVNYWFKGFPVALDTTARAHFQATAPRLEAAYTEEMDSWWMRARNYANLIDRDAYVMRFFDKLDQTLDKMISK